MNSNQGINFLDHDVSKPLVSIPKNIKTLNLKNQEGSPENLREFLTSPVKAEVLEHSHIQYIKADISNDSDEESFENNSYETAKRPIIVIINDSDFYVKTGYKITSMDR